MSMSKTLCTAVTISPLACLLACAEAAPLDRPDAHREADAAAGADTGAVDASASLPDARATVDASSGALVLNELAPDGSPDFVELYNPTSSSIEVAGLVLADADGVGDMPDPTHRVTLPALTVGAGEYLVIALNVDPPAGTTETPVGPVSPCPLSDVDSCLQASFGIGRTGDTVVLLARDGLTALARVDYAGDLMGADASYCRFPNATGDFTTCTSTPGTSNTR
ncbi:MAG: lamin tail domain-containing protein [Sandaracinaceae bacterium]|nr:lamin tail domain-containing protein [Sandaracinaceae bacterium]